MPGANPTGYRDNNPIIIHAIPDDMAVANNTPVVGIPVSDNSIGFIPKMYAIAKSGNASNYFCFNSRSIFL